ncbi:MAG TPA: branched-chain amino acid ABC transporter substrate-binding protein [Solirubrobacteraceae bacterium]|nr:branched-chain amino acid ABC transporter substrate-binding protein [Solirubrobacteraceae bacterium]
MLSRRLGLAALAAAVPALAGCGSVISASETTGNQLTVYSSLPLQGPSAPLARQIEGGEKLALSDAGGHVGSFRVSYVSLDDVNPKNGQTSPGESSAAAKQAAQDTSTIAYLGDYGSEATAISLPLINEAGILQVSVSAPYVGLTSSEDAGQDEPSRFYPSRTRNFVRLQPGDQAQAEAQVRLMRSLALHRVYVLDDQNPFQMPLATLVAQDAGKEGVTVAGHDSIPVEAEANYAGEVEKILAAKPQAVFVAAGSGPGAVELWKSLHAADPSLLLLGPSSLVSEQFTAALGAAAGVTYLTTPLLPESLYPPSARRLMARYTHVFHRAAGPSVLYGYEAMDGVLDAIRRAGSRGNNRPDVIRSYMATRDRDSVIGRYSVMPNGETTLSTYGVDRVAGGQAVFSRAIDTGSPPGPAG